MKATSGLDAEHRGAHDTLFRSLSDEGKSIVCITHNVDNVDRCHLTIILVRGKLIFFGPPAEAPVYFGVGKISEIYDRLADREPADWEKEFSACSLYREYVEKRQAASPTESGALAIAAMETPITPSGLFGNVLNQVTQAASASGQDLVAEHLRQLTRRYLKARELLRPVSDAWRQFRVLTQRYTELILGDRRSLSLLFMQAPLVALFLLLGFVDKPYADDILAPRKLSVERACRAPR